MLLSRVIVGTGASLGQAPDAEVSAVTSDSRRVKPGALFVAVPGARADGADFAPAAVRSGAVAVLAERPLDCPPSPVLLVPSARRALAIAAGNLHGRPGERLALCGVTGTKGKTTVTYLVEACAAAAGVATGVVGTVNVRLPGRTLPSSHTTPDAAELQEFLAAMLEAGARLAILEVSSHALDQERVAGLPFRAAGFTNLGRDHLDYHPDVESYFQAKRRLFTEGLSRDGVAVVNAGDAHGALLAAELRAAGRTVWRFGVPGAEIAPAVGGHRPVGHPHGAVDAVAARSRCRRRWWARTTWRTSCSPRAWRSRSGFRSRRSRPASPPRAAPRDASSASTGAGCRPSSTTPTRPTRSPPPARPSAPSRRAGSSWSSAAAATGTGASGRSWGAPPAWPPTWWW